MIKPYLQDETLIRDIDQAVPPARGVCVWWLTQSGFVLKAGSTIVYVDPYLSEHLTRKYANTDKPHVRMTGNPLRPELIRHADLVISTHKHSDHMDPLTIPALLRASPRARYVLPRAHLEHVRSWGLDPDRLVGVEADEPLAVAGIDLLPIPAAHEQVERTARGEHVYLGFILRMGGMTIYHSGDTIPYPGLMQRLLRQPVDLAFLPINGRDARRHALGTPGNCTVEEALGIAAMAGVGTLVPHHYDLFTFNTVPVEAFTAWAAEAWPRQRVLVMTCGKAQVVEPVPVA